MLRRRTTSRLLGAVALAAVMMAACVGCTHNSDDTNSSPDQSAPTTATAPSITLTRPNAKFVATIEELGGGVPNSKRQAVRVAISKPIQSWFTQAYLAPTYPATAYPHAFDSWTKGAAAQASRNAGTLAITTNAAVGDQLVAVVADAQRAKLYVFATKGTTGGATAKVRLALTGQQADGSLVSYAVWGELYLTRDSGKWSIFGYHLQRAVRT